MPKLKVAPLTADDVRRIREKLGLSQAEAGELLGGGPRAFTKYENGTIKPAAAFANLLRTLDTNPGVLSSLTGAKLPPIEADGLRPFEVTGNHISALSERKLVSLTRRLLAAEAQSNALPMDGIHVAAVITAPDGGEDAKIEWVNGPERTKWLPARYTQIQLKVGGLNPADAASEVMTATGDVKPMVQALLNANGTYVLISAHSYTDKLVKAREAAVRKKLADAGLDFRPEQVQFRDADQVALWVNEHPPVAAWLLEQTQPGLAGVFRDWMHWAGRYSASPWTSDDRLPALTDWLRPIVTTPRGVARIVGLSGYGKSRLVHEAFAPTLKEEQGAPRLSDIVLYAVESEVGSTPIKTAVQVLVDAGIRSVIVVDRCPAETHQDLAAMVKRSDSRLSLITIDHEVTSAERLPADTYLIRRAEDSLIQTMIERIAPNLPSEDQRRLVRFSQGVPQLATLLGEAWLKDSSVAGCSDDELFDRILIGRKPIDPVLIRETAMLVAAFGLIGFKAPLIDLKLLTPLTRDRSEADLRTAIDEQLQRGVMQKHGRLVSLQPKPLAMALAEKQWRAWDETQREFVLAGTLPPYLRVRAARQLALLNDRPIAMEVAQRICRLDGPLASCEALSVDGAPEVLSALAEIDGEAVLTLLEHLFDRQTCDDLRQVSGNLRRHLVWALEKVAFAKGTFERAALLLLRLGTAENEKYGNNATGQFKNLFPVFLSNTEAEPPARLQLLDELITRNDQEQMPIVVDALIRGTDIHSSTRWVGAETHGSRPALKPWHPTLWKDAWDYVLECLNRLADLGLRDDALGKQARAGIPRCFRPMVQAELISDIEVIVKKILTKQSYWPAAYDALGDVLQFDSSEKPEAIIGRVRALMTLLNPQDFESRVRFIINEMPWDYPSDKVYDYAERTILQQEAVNTLIGEMLQSPGELERLLPEMSAGTQRMSFTAGTAIAKQSDNPAVWAPLVRAALEATPERERNFGLLIGFYSGLDDRDKDAVESFKREAAASPVLSYAFPAICSAIGITEHDILLACKGLSNGTLQPHQMLNWVGGGVLAKLPLSAVTPLFDLMLGMKEGYSAAVDLMGMYVHPDIDRLNEMRPQLLLTAKNVGNRSNPDRGSMDAHQFERMMGWLLSKGSADADARAVAIELASQLAAIPDDAEHMIAPVLQTLLSNFDAIVWPILGGAIVSDRGKAWKLEHVLGHSYSFAEKKTPPILSVSVDILFAWCRAHRDVGPAFLAQFVPFLSSQRPEEGGNTLHPFATRILDEFGDQEEVLKKFVQNIFTFGWTGSRTSYYAMYDASLRVLETHKFGTVRRWAKNMHREMRTHFEAAKTEDDEQEAGWSV